MVQVANPTTLFMEEAASLYNRVGAASLPAASADTYGINRRVWEELIALTRARMADIGYGIADGNMRGLCIYASVVAAKFLRHRAMIYATNVVRVTGTGGSDHYFAVAGTGPHKVVCDLTCGQFAGPDWIVGTVPEVVGAAQSLRAFGEPLIDAYRAGVATDTFVI